MHGVPADLSTSNIMIVNDDGIHAQGIKLLEDCAQKTGADIWVVAPETEQSAAGHSLTIHTPLRIREYDNRHISVFGTPTDCAVMGIHYVMKASPPDLVLSGINHGKNSGDDVTYSGTIAAAIEATLLGYPAIAFSQHIAEETLEASGQINWDMAKKYVPEVLQKLSGMELMPMTLLNVNLPLSNIEPKGIIVVPQGHYNVSTNVLLECEDPRGKKYFWIKPPPKMEYDGISEDVGALDDGYITITPLSLNLTNWDMLKKLREYIDK